MFISNLTNNCYYLEEEKNTINNKINALKVILSINLILHLDKKIPKR